MCGACFLARPTVFSCSSAAFLVTLRSLLGNPPQPPWLANSFSLVSKPSHLAKQRG